MRTKARGRRRLMPLVRRKLLWIAIAVSMNLILSLRLFTQDATSLMVSILNMTLLNALCVVAKTKSPSVWNEAEERGKPMNEKLSNKCAGELRNDQLNRDVASSDSLDCLVGSEKSYVQQLDEKLEELRSRGVTGINVTSAKNLKGKWDGDEPTDEDIAREILMHLEAMEKTVPASQVTIFD